MSPNCGVFSGMRCLKMLFFGLPSHKFLATPLHSWNCFNKGRFVCVGIFVVLGFFCLRCFDVLVGCQEGFTACKKPWVAGRWRGYLSGERCRLAYGPADATATHCLLLQKNPDWFYFSGTGLRVVLDKGPLNGVCVCRIFCTFHVLFSRLVYPVSCICELGVLWLNTYQVFMPLPIDCFRAVHPSVRVCMWVEVFPLLDAVGFSV